MRGNKPFMNIRQTKCLFSVLAAFFLSVQYYSRAIARHQQ